MIAAKKVRPINDKAPWQGRDVVTADSGLNEIHSTLSAILCRIDSSLTGVVALLAVVVLLAVGGIYAR